MTEQEQAAADPRVGDKWEQSGETGRYVREVRAIDDHDVIHSTNGARPVRCPKVFWKTAISVWTLAARGPAPATPARDPATTPVVGDEWMRPDGNRLEVVVVRTWYVRVATSAKEGIFRHDDYTLEDFAHLSKQWKPIRRGDDPAWRPEGERSEQPAAGIKVGDRVRHLHREEGVVKSKDDYGVKIQFDGDNKTQTFSFADVRHWLTIIPPAAAPDDTEQPEPIEAIDRNPHTEPLVGDEWEDDELDTLRVVHIEPRIIVVLNLSSFHASLWSRQEFSDVSMTWRLSKAADMDTDDVGDEPPTPAYQGDPIAERFTTYQPDPVEEQHYRDSKYIRSIRSVNGTESIDVDVYEVLEAFAVTCPATAHAVKKILCAGIRGSKSRLQDLREAGDSISRAMEMQHQREAVAAAKGTTCTLTSS